jgi:parvulin-like peptidyl-prolyl isomerase
MGQNETNTKINSFENLKKELKSLKKIEDLKRIEKKYSKHTIFKDEVVISDDLSKYMLKKASLNTGEYIEATNKKSFTKVFEKSKVECVKISMINLLDKTEKGALLATEIIEKFQSGEDFSLLAKKYSKDEHYSKKGGEIPWVKKGYFIEDFENLVFPLKKGNISSFYSKDFGWSVVLKTQKNKYLENVKLVTVFK